MATGERPAGPVYRGVRYDARFHKFEGRAYIEHKTRYLGNYQSAVEAAYAVNVASAQSAAGATVPNILPADALAPDEKASIAARVRRLLSPDRRPHQRKYRA